MDLIKKSIEVIKSLQLKNGSILATFKNDTYPFVYPRDATIMTKALNLKGLHKNSERFYYFLKSLKYFINQRYHGFGFGVGLPYITQRGEVDNSGLVLHGIWNTSSFSSNQKFLEDMWPLVKKCVFRIEQATQNGLVYSRRSIHEYFELEEGHEIWANSACCRGLFDASEIAKSLGKKEAKLWRFRAENLKKNIYKKMLDKRKKIFVKVIRTSGKKILAPDISQLAPFYFDLIDSNEILERTLKILRKTLWHRKLGGFLRFRFFEICKNWHWYTGGDGPFSVFTIIAAKMFRKIGNKKNYEECEKWIQKISTREGFLPERISLKKDYDEWKRNEFEFSERILNGIKRAENLRAPIKGVMYWATPLGWAHAEYILLHESLC